MKIEIGQYFIEGDGDGFIIYELIPKKNKEGVLTGHMGKANVRWHPTLESACNRVFGLLVSCSEVQSVKGLVEYAIKIKQEMLDEIKEALFR